MQNKLTLTLLLMSLSMACAGNDAGVADPDDTDVNAERASSDDDGVGDDAAEDDGDAEGMKDAGKPSVEVPKPPVDAGKVRDATTLTPTPTPADSGVKAPPSADGGTLPVPPVGTPTECLASATAAPGSTMNLTLGERKYTLHIGRAVKVGTAAPLVFSLHGLTMTPASMESMARWYPLSDSEGFIVAGPAGVGSSNGWDLSGTKDFDLMKAVIEDVNKKACVDRKRIYSTGFSHGGFMSFANVCKLSDVFAAAAPHSGAGACRNASVRAMPIFTWHGDADGTVSYSSGKSAHDSWVTHNKCGAPTDFSIGSNKCQEWKGCTDDVPMKMCTIPGGGHRWSGDATKAIWEFFKGITLP